MAKKKLKKLLKKNSVWRNRHPSVAMLVNGEMIEVDKQMVPVITWLNGLPSVFTTSCCQGGKYKQADGRGGIEKPFVLFHANQDDLKAIMVKLHAPVKHLPGVTFECAAVEVQLFNNDFRYCMRFHSKQNLKMFLDLLRTNKNHVVLPGIT